MSPFRSRIQMNFHDKNNGRVQNEFGVLLCWMSSINRNSGQFIFGVHGTLRGKQIYTASGSTF